MYQLAAPGSFSVENCGLQKAPTVKYIQRQATCGVIKNSGEKLRHSLFRAKIGVLSLASNFWFQQLENKAQN